MGEGKRRAGAEMNWDYKLEPEEDEKAQRVADRVWEMKDEEVLNLAKVRGMLELDEDGEVIIPEKLNEIRERLEDYLYWEEE